jgi:hypothetical protein
MSVRKNDPTDAEPGRVVDETRRRLTGAGLAGSGVLLTLVSHPVLGRGLGGNQCTKSAILSGNLSNPQDNTQCGCSPGYWGHHPEVWSKLTDGQYLPGMLFNAAHGAVHGAHRHAYRNGDRERELTLR